MKVRVLSGIIAMDLLYRKERVLIIPQIWVNQQRKKGHNAIRKLSEVTFHLILDHGRTPQFGRGCWCSRGQIRTQHLKFANIFTVQLTSLSTYSLAVCVDHKFRLFLSHYLHPKYHFTLPCKPNSIQNRTLGNRRSKF